VRTVDGRQTVKAKEDQPMTETGTKTRVKQAEARTEQAEARTEQAETRTEQAETALEHCLHKEVDSLPVTPLRLLATAPVVETADPQNPLEQLTIRQREILQLIAEGQNTKQIADILKVSPKTVDYHRMKLMAGLNLHDVPGLVRYALRVGLISAES
jgi:DNA-binding CsgD family transcriptional regulator